ncbi:hypothetical protein F5X68DRAFT_225225 [Plectosphaerella plurivora]|uniref:SH3 domain-containing protein n=1 Tax=Plectosphaerella plurivora TaxID=936078 RepID=A0A9P9A6T4_9PEZI|nr:hypothetical protein F5X68DRAFT_225225 [Plectosphaerella plurivora]
MARPHIIRADTIDLQDTDAPSAKDHTRTTQPNSTLAPHQAETLREVAQDTADENARSPRLSLANSAFDDSDPQKQADAISAGVTERLKASANGSGKAGANANNMQREDNLAVAQNGGHSIRDDDSDTGGDTDESMDDDMMDKISSSPSIEDGGCAPLPLSREWPRRLDSLPPPGRRDSPLSSPIPGEHSPAPGPDDQPYPDHDDTLDELYDELDRYLESGRDKWWRTHEAKFQVDAAAKHGPSTVRPLDVVKSSDQSHIESKRRNRGSDEHEDAHFDWETEYSDDGLTIPYDGTPSETSFFEDDDCETSPIDPAYLDSGWCGQCLRDLEDIDFDFVYALHTFVATVEGQANATKGDTMVLLDDSNSYWWLVRVVKDNSIGYLPAEHIETPTERLARLNKHRNIDLSASMLQDQAGEKSKSTFRLRGKKKKNVVFAEPTYVDYSDFDDYSSEEDQAAELFGQAAAAQDKSKVKTDKDAKASADQTQKAATNDAMSDETAKVEPLKPRSKQEIVVVTEAGAETPEEAEARRSSEQFFESRLEAPSRSRNGTVRNTDSFFKDETVETKKITLTPNLLRDDNQPRPSNESAKDAKRPSLDKMEKMERELQPDKKDDKKKKDKKPSAIRSFFSRKDKKKAADDDDDSLGKRSMDTSNDGEEDEVLDKSAPSRQPSKLQKAQPRAEPSPTRKAGSTPQKSSTRELAEYIASEGRTNDVSNVPPSSMRLVQEKEALETSRDRSPEMVRSASQQKEERTGGLAKIKQLSRTGSDKSAKADKPQKVTKAKARVELDDFDTSDEEDTTISEPVKQQQAPAPVQETKTLEPKALRPQLPGAYPDSYMTTGSNQSDKTVTPADMQTQRTPATERLSESPVQVSPVTSNNPPALVGDTSSQEEDDENSASPSPELVEVTDAQRHRAQESSVAGSTSTGASNASSTWNDAKLRAFFDSSDDIRDMLVVVYDKTDVAPAGPDHPVAGPLFREQNAKLAEITTQLDNMLGDWLARKQRLRGAV